MSTNNLTRINNNQISSASAGNIYLGINAANKVQGYSITSGLLANNLTYGSDLTVSGNLTVQGTTTAVNTVNTLISDPLIVLADGQTTGTPTVDIGYIGLRGSQDNIAVAWKEGDKEVVAAFTTTESGNVYSNTTFTISSYANFHSFDLTASGNLAVTGTTSLVGNIISDANVTGDITGGNVYTAGEVSAAGNITTNPSSFFIGNGSQLTGVTASSVDAGNLTGNTLAAGVIYSSLTSVGTLSSLSVSGDVTGGNLYTGGAVSATGNITGANFSTTGSSGNIFGANNIIATTISGTSNVIGGNITTGGYVTATGSVTGGNIYTAGEVSAAGNITADASSFFIGNGSQLTGVTASSVDAGNLTGNTLAAGVIYSSLTSVGTLSSLSVSGSTTSGNLYTGGEVSATGTATAGNVSTGGYVTATGNVTGGNVLTGGTASATGTVTGGNLATGGTASATGTVTGGNVETGGYVSATGTVTGGNLATGGTASVTGNATVGNLLTGGLVSAQGNVLGGNVVTDYVYSTNTANTTLTITAATISLNPTGNVGLNSRWINNLADPTANQDAATKIYVDTVAQGLSAKAACDVASQTYLANTSMTTNVVYNNGTNGVGATLIVTTTTDLILDSVNLVTLFGTLGANSRVLIKSETGSGANDTNAAWNGIYNITAATGIAVTLTRSADFNQPAEMYSAYTFIQDGTLYADTGWTCTNNDTTPIVIGTTAINWVQFSGAGQYTAGNALTLSGTQFNVNIDTSGANTIGINGSNELYIPASATLTTPNIGAATGTSVSVTGSVTGGNLYTGGEVSATGTATAGNVSTGGYVTATGNVTGGNVLTGGESSASGNVTGGNVLTGGLVSATSTVTGGNLATGGTVSATGTVTGGNVETGGYVSATGTATAGNVETGGYVSATGSVTGGNLYTGGDVSATGNITGANFSTTGSSGNITGANNIVATTISGTSTVIGGNVETGGYVTATGNVTGGNVLTGGLISATSDITGGNIYTGGEVSATGNITASSSSFFIGNGSQLTGVSASSANAETLTGAFLANNVVGSSLTSVGTLGNLSVSGDTTTGNLLTGGTVSATGTVTGGNVETGGYVSATGTVTGGNVETGGYVSATGNITGGNIYTAGALQGGNIVISGDDITDTNGRVNFNTALDTVDFAVNGLTANVLYVNATTGTASFGNATQTTNSIVAFNASTSVLMPVGNTTQRPAGGVTGQLRFNTTINSLEIYDNSAWTAVGQPNFTVITDQQFNGTGSQTVYTLSGNATTAGTIVSINGVQQIPTTAYSVSDTTLTFTEAPEIGDLIDVRTLVTTTQVYGITNGSGSAQVNVQDGVPNVAITGGLVVDSGTGFIYGDGTYLTNVGGGNVTANKIASGNSQVNIATPGGDVYIAVAGANVFDISTSESTFTGNLNPYGNALYSLGNASNQWKSLYVSNNTIYIGGTAIATAAGQLTVGGNAVVTVGQTTTGSMSVTGTVTGGNLATGGTVSATGNITGGNISATLLTGTTVSVTGNITGAYIIGNGAGLTGLPAGYTNSNVSTFLAAFGSNSISTTGTVTSSSTVGGVITGSSTSVTGTVTAASTVGGVITGSSTSVTGTVTAASTVGGVITGSSASVTGNVTGANLNTTGTATIAGFTISGNTIVAAGTTLTIDPNGSGGVDGLVVIAGNLQVNGNTTTINSNVVSTNDLTINYANNAINSAAANGGGIEVGPIGSPFITWLYNNTANVFTSSGGISAVGTVTAASTVGGVITGSSASVSGTVTAASTVGGVITGSSASVSGTVTGGNVTTAGQLTVNSGANVTAIVNGATTGVGNIGSSTVGFNTVFAKATTAQYADLAEKYTADAEYAPGTVLVFGGNQEVTVNSVDSDSRVAGVVSTNPGFVMNEGLDSEFVASVALTGRVPTLVIGPVRKGDLMVVAGLGRARAEATPRVGTVIGKALEDFDGAEGTIEVVVGRF